MKSETQPRRMMNRPSRKRSLNETSSDLDVTQDNNKHACLQSCSDVKLVLAAIPANKQTLRRGTKEWPTRKEPPSEVDVLWYKDEGGNSNSLNFCVQLVDKETGEPALGYHGVTLKHELLIRGEPIVRSEHTLLGLELTPGCRPVIDPDGTCTLRLRITDVSKNHGNVPFRVRISLSDETSLNYSDVGAVCSEMIAVRSKRGGAVRSKSISPNLVPRPTVVQPQKVYGNSLHAGQDIGMLVDRLQGCQNVTTSQRTELQETTAGVMKCTSVAFQELEQLHSHLGNILAAYKTSMGKHVERLQNTVAAVEAAGDGDENHNTAIPRRKVDVNVSNLAQSGSKTTAFPHPGLVLPALGRSISVGSNFSIDMQMFNELGFSPRFDP